MVRFRFIRLFLTCLIAFGIAASPSYAQRNKKQAKAATEENTEEHYLSKLSLSGLTYRSIGPALTSGRISDFAVNPDNPSEYYVATSSGGVWKTVNAGTTFKPIFDSQGSYSIGCITMDPNNPNVIWVGTGENNNQRSVNYGDGLYKSEDGGSSWKKVGLDKSEHIGKIIVDPRNSDVVYVAAIGPLWSSGGDRGLYKTTDGGATWDTVLYISEHTGINEIVMDPRNPDVMYASALQRRRHVFTYIGGGPESGIYKTTDGGEHWKKVNKGLPQVDLGRIGLAISPADPEIIYAIVEAAQGKGGFYASTNRGASWEKRGSYVTSGNYYQEIIADPVNPNKVFAMNNWMRYTVDGGRTFEIVGEDYKHIDNHCMWIDPTDTDHLLVGCDGGIYETWDHAKTWHFKANLPVTQFYKVAIDSMYPMYNVYGGTQDNFSIGGPTRTTSDHGIVNSDWFITNGGDGFESQVDPDNPNIVFAQSQYGGLVRYDKSNGEKLGIKPQERKGENNYRWNWDAPLAVSRHKAGRVYFSANKVFRSDDYGDSWEVISDDLTAQINRNELKVMDRIWGIDAVAKNGSTSPFGTIVAFSESPLNENLLYVGTDDGLIQITENGGQSWTKVDNFPGAPEMTYVNAVYASQHDENVVYAVFNHHKYGDFKPYVYKSSDKGATWTSISSNLPERGSVYCIEEDHVDPDLLFVGTEFSAFFTNDGGGNWKKLNMGLPTIAVRDITIHSRANDLVLGTFGRGFYVLDDYSALRELTEENLEKEAMLFATREAFAFEMSVPLGLPGKSFQGDSYYMGDNLGSEALFTFYVKEGYKSMADGRREKESEAKKEGKDNSYPTYEALKAEREERSPQLLLTIKNSGGEVVRKLAAAYRGGLQRVKWDLRYSESGPVSFAKPSFYNPFAGKPEGTLVAPGAYTLTLSKVMGDEIIDLDGPYPFEIKPLNNASMPNQDRQAKEAFQQEVAELSNALGGVQQTLSSMDNQLRHIREAMKRMKAPMENMLKEVVDLEDQLRAIRLQLFGDGVASTLDQDTPKSVTSRVGYLSYSQYYSTAPPSKGHLLSFEIAKEEFEPILQEVRRLSDEVLPALQQKLERAGAPFTPGRKVDYGKN
jgi:photosystem II stability/assembly factor-like uncharacterized protein/uncharacterized coiled-coil protein SlyX